MDKSYILFSILFLVYSCRDSHHGFSDAQNDPHSIQFEGEVGKFEVEEGQGLSIDWKEDTVFWDLPYPIYRWEIEDFNGDGNDEIFVGVIKKTKFDPKVKKRLFIFKIFDYEIRPLWLGSNVAYPLLDFSVKRQNDTTYIVTEELKNETDTVNGFYIKAPFGISWVKHENSK